MLIIAKPSRIHKHAFFFLGTHTQTLHYSPTVHKYLPLHILTASFASPLIALFPLHFP
jgi:hypothetical protein